MACALGHKACRDNHAVLYVRVPIFPNEAAIVRLVGAILLEKNDKWMVQRSRYLSLETIATLSDNPLVSLPDMAN